MEAKLINLCSNNAAFFGKDTSKSGQCLHTSFMELIEHINFSIPLLKQIHFIAPQHDFDNVPANGYRSALSIVDIAMSDCIVTNEQIVNKRDTILFSKRRFKREVKVHSQVMRTLASFLVRLVNLIKCSEGELLYTKCQSLEEFFNLVDMDDLVCFYGGNLGFQFCKSMRSILRKVAIGMATYHEVYHSKQCKPVRSLHWVWSGGKYVFNPKLRAQKVLEISQCTSIDFCKSFWMLTETDLLGRVPAMICPKVAVNQVISIPTEPLEHMARDGRRVEIPIPHSHFEPTPVMTRLLSTIRREGMDGSGPTAPRSRHLIFHCHGGGFVAQSSQSHEIYLRDWAKQLDIPILSIDYSLAPLAAYPRPLEEVLYAYSWALANGSRLGTSAEYVILAGDSAGANLCVGLALKCIDLGLTRPVGMFLAYAPILISPVPSPSRALSLMDSLVPLGFLLNCLRAYDPSLASSTQCTGITLNGTIQNEENSINNKTSTNEEEVVVKPEENNALLDEASPGEEKSIAGSCQHPFSLFIAEQRLTDSRDPFISPYWASNQILNQLPPMSIVTLEFDPCLDDCVLFARRLKSLGNTVTLDVLAGLPHGFLNFAMLCKEAHEGSNLCVRRIKELFEIAHQGEATS